jgi:hypothetical protein
LSREPLHILAVQKHLDPRPFCEALPAGAEAA